MGRVVLSSVLMIILWPLDVAACSCIGPRNAAEAVDASVIFRGRVANAAVRWHTELWRVVDDDFYASPVEVEFEVSEVWQGNVGSTAVVLTGFGDGDCGFPFIVGDEYVVPAYTGPDGWHTGICSGIEWLSASSSLSSWASRYSQFPTRASLWRDAFARVYRATAILSVTFLCVALLVGGREARTSRTDLTVPSGPALL